MQGILNAPKSCFDSLMILGHRYSLDIAMFFALSLFPERSIDRYKFCVKIKSLSRSFVFNFLSSESSPSKQKIGKIFLE
ncbi:hypothetical protein ES705_45163 [subsurface metagenome]